MPSDTSSSDTSSSSDNDSVEEPLGDELPEGREETQHQLYSEQHQYESPHDTETDKRSCAKTYLLMDKKSFALFTMAIGFDEFDGILVKSPYKDTKKKEFTDSFKPNKTSLQNEIRRRSHFLMKENTDHNTDHPLYQKGKVQAPRPSQWKREKMIDWLKTHTLALDLAFLKDRIESYGKHLGAVLRRRSVSAQLDVTRSAQKGREGVAPRTASTTSGGNRNRHLQNASEQMSYSIF